MLIFSSATTRTLSITRNFSLRRRLIIHIFIPRHNELNIGGNRHSPLSRRRHFAISGLKRSKHFMGYLSNSAGRRVAKGGGSLAILNVMPVQGVPTRKGVVRTVQRGIDMGAAVLISYYADQAAPRQRAPFLVSENGRIPPFLKILPVPCEVVQLSAIGSGAVAEQNRNKTSMREDVAFFEGVGRTEKLATFFPELPQERFGILGIAQQYTNSYGEPLSFGHVATVKGVGGCLQELNLIMKLLFKLG